MCTLRLRIQIFPNVPTVSDSLKTKWEDNLTSCSCKMMKILQEHYDQELTNIEKEVLEISSKLTPFHDLGLYKNSLNNPRLTQKFLIETSLEERRKKSNGTLQPLHQVRPTNGIKQIKKNTLGPNGQNLKDPTLTNHS